MRPIVSGASVDSGTHQDGQMIRRGLSPNGQSPRVLIQKMTGVMILQCRVGLHRRHGVQLRVKREPGSYDAGSTAIASYVVHTLEAESRERPMKQCWRHL